VQARQYLDGISLADELVCLGDKALAIDISPPVAQIALFVVETPLKVISFTSGSAQSAILLPIRRAA